MSNKSTEQLFKLDLYEILGLSIGADEKEIKKSFRKKALVCHPDKNPDDPNAAEEFNKLKKILEIFLDPGARQAYDKVLKAKKAAALRTKQADLTSQKLRTDLERKEKAALNKPQISEEERLKREIKRLEEEGAKLIEEELNILNQEAKLDINKLPTQSDATPLNSDSAKWRVKAKWKSTEEAEGYTEEEIKRLFYKWGEIHAIVMKSKGGKNTALIEFKEKNGACLAVDFEKGLPGKPIEVTWRKNPTEKPKPNEKNPQDGLNTRDFESIASMNCRREAERKKLIEEMLKEDSLFK